MQNKVLLKIYESVNEGYKCALITLFKNKGSAPGKEGNVMAVREDGKTYGTIGGGAIEYQIIKEAIENININNDFEFDYLLNEGEKVSMSCGRRTRGFGKIFYPKPKLIIFGAGHCSQKLARIATLTNFEVIVVDDRDEFRHNEDFSNIKKYLNCEIKEAVNLLNFDNNTYIVSATRDHKHDEEVAYYILNKKYKFFGMLGSTKKAKILKENLENRGISKSLIKNINVPVGLDIDDGSVEEIAISILSQILQVKNEK